MQDIKQEYIEKQSHNAFYLNDEVKSVLEKKFQITKNKITALVLFGNGSLEMVIERRDSKQGIGCPEEYAKTVALLKQEFSTAVSGSLGVGVWFPKDFGYSFIISAFPACENKEDYQNVLPANFSM